MAKGRMSADAFNMMWITIILISVAVICLVVFLIVTAVNGGVPSTSVNAVPAEMVSHRFTGVRRGPLVVCGEDNPWRQEEVERVGEQVIPVLGFSVGEVPYTAAKPDIMLQPEALSALSLMARDMPRPAGVTLCVEAGYATWEGTGNIAGKTPYHTGYAVRVSIAVGNSRVRFEEASVHPTAASPAAWVGANLTAYGFIKNGANGDILYVGLPHAAIMHAQNHDLSDYLTWVRGMTQNNPYAWETANDEYRLFYLPAAYDAAVLRVEETATVYAVGDGVGGFVVAVRFDK